MNIADILKKYISKSAYKNTYNRFNKIEMQKEYLGKFRLPSDDLERSYFQYKCQMYMEGIKGVFMNLASIPLLFYYINIRKSNNLEYDSADAVFIDSASNFERLPKSLLSEYTTWKREKLSGEYMDMEDKEFFKVLSRRYPLSWQLQLKCLIKLRNYSYLIHMYTPLAIATCSEYSFTSSFLTAYCEKKGVKHIDIMHGDKMFYIRDSFFRFHDMYIWHEHYAELFKKLKATENNFIVDIPEKFYVNCMNSETIHDFTYYLQIDTREQLVCLEQNLHKLKNRGYDVAIRPHPIASNIQDVYEIFKGYYIENGKDTSIEQSICDTKCLISLYSTVLFQGYCSKKKIIIDDISKRDVYESLKKMDYIGLSLPHKVLSEII